MLTALLAGRLPLLIEEGLEGLKGVPLLGLLHALRLDPGRLELGRPLVDDLDFLDGLTDLVFFLDIFSASSFSMSFSTCLFLCSFHT
jgi:hypothetical protein